MALAQRKEERPYTYADYLSWNDEKRWEIIDGIAYMQAAPSWEHQKILGEIHVQFHKYLIGKLCQAYMAPFDVRLSENNETDENSTTTVQPDLSIICDKSKLKGTGYFGVPSLIVEILSPTTASYDKKIKLKRYERAGVKELWVVDPANKTLDVFNLENGKYSRPETYSNEDKLIVNIFSDLEIDLNPVFDF